MARPNLTAAMLTQLNASRSKPGHLFEAYFDDETVRFTDFYTTLTWGGNSYVADGEALSYDGVQEDLEMRAPMARVVFSGVDQAWIQRVLTKNYRNRRLVIRKATLDASYQVVIDPVPEFDGLMKQPQVQDDPDNGTCTIVFSASHDASDVNNASGRRTNDEFERKLYPNDGFFKYASQAGKQLLLGGGVSAQTTSTQTSKATSPASSVAVAVGVVGAVKAISAGIDALMNTPTAAEVAVPAAQDMGSEAAATTIEEAIYSSGGYTMPPGVASGADQSLTGSFATVPTMPPGVAAGTDQTLTGAFETMPMEAGAEAGAEAAGAGFGPAVPLLAMSALQMAMSQTDTPAWQDYPNRWYSINTVDGKQAWANLATGATLSDAQYRAASTPGEPTYDFESGSYSPTTTPPPASYSVAGNPTYGQLMNYNDSVRGSYVGGPQGMGDMVFQVSSAPRWFWD